MQLTMWPVEITNMTITVYLTTWFVDCFLLSKTNRHITKSVKYMPEIRQVGLVSRCQRGGGDLKFAMTDVPV